MKSLLIAVVLTISANAWASDRVTQSNDNNAQTTGDVNIAGDSSKAYGIGHALGDVDINQCLGSTQWGTPVYSKQKLVINWPCMAEFYLKNDAPELAAMALCNTEILDEFADEAECEAAHSFLKAIQVPAATEVLDDHWEEEEEWHEEQMQMQIDYDMRIARLEEELKRPKPKTIERVVEQRGLTDEQKAALREVVK